MISIPYKTANGSAWVPIESWMLSEGRIFIHGDITEEVAGDFVEKILYLKSVKPDENVRIYINSCGGEVNAGMLIYDAIKGLRNETDIICTGMAASMAAIILAGGQKGRRFILPHSKVMIHEPLIAGGVGGSATTIQRTAESILETKKASVELLASDTAKSIADVEKAISFDNYMNAKEAVAFGICDRIITEIV